MVARARARRSVACLHRRSCVMHAGWSLLFSVCIVLHYSSSRRIRTWDRFLGQRRWKLSEIIISHMHSNATVILM